MSHSKPRLSGRLNMQRPSVNWNRTSGSGIRTSLGGSRPSLGSNTAASPTTAVPEAPIEPTAPPSIENAEPLSEPVEAVFVPANQDPTLHDNPATLAPVVNLGPNGGEIQANDHEESADSLYGSPARQLDPEIGNAHESSSDGEILSDSEFYSAASPHAELAQINKIDIPDISDRGIVIETSNHGKADLQPHKVTDLAVVQATEDGEIVSIDEGEIESSYEAEIMTNIITQPTATAISTSVSQQAEEATFMKLYIPGVVRTTTEGDIRALFNGYPTGRIEIKQVFGRPTNECYIQIAGATEAQRAIRELDGRYINGRSIKLKFAQDNAPLISAVQATASSAKILQDEETRQRSLSGSFHSTGSESGEVVDESDEDLDSELEFEDDSDSDQEIIEIESDEDPMITDYSNARQSRRPTATNGSGAKIEIIDLEKGSTNEHPDFIGCDLSKPSPTTLAELTREQLECQVMYWYPTRHPTTIPETDLVHCYLCNQTGHLLPWCPERSCSHCEAKDQHRSNRCPTKLPCSRCRQRGHAVDNCPHKLKSNDTVIQCSYCQEVGHLEQDCELNWRTSGRLWQKPIPDWVPLSCFFCGGSSHLANDCSSRPRGMPMSSSNWTKHGLPQPFPIHKPTLVFNPSILAPPSRRNKDKMPNSKAKGLSAPAAKPVGGNRQQVFPPNNKLPAKKTNGKPSIQIKGLANRAKLDSPARPSPRGGNPALGRYFDDELESGAFVRGRPNNGNRPRSRSRSPKGWYQPMPRAVNQYRDRDESRNYGRRR